MANSLRTPPDRYADLVREARCGCTDSFEQLVRDFHLPLRLFLVAKTGDAIAADDLAQEVFLAASKQINNIENESSFRSWLYAVARNKAVDFLRSKSRNRETSFGRLDHLLDARQSDLFPDSTRLVAVLRSCLAKLKPRARVLVNAFYFQNRTSEQIAADLETNSNTVRMTLMRTRRVLAKCIKANAGDDDETFGF